MQFAIGYQPASAASSFVTLAADYQEAVREVYFPWPGAPSGRPPILSCEELPAAAAERMLTDDLSRIRALGIRLDLLMNANCYGKDAVSKTFEGEIRSILEKLTAAGCRPEIITTTSLFVARTIRKYAPDLEVRASVNMRIGTTQAMGYVGDLFDSFYLQRDFQRDLDYVRLVSDWCKTHNKKLCMLANSGCLRFCPGQSFHDNLIAHSGEIEPEDCVAGYNPHVCWNLYQGGKNGVELLKATWIRPEDLHVYGGLVDVVKLATRQHSHPRSVIGAYAAGRWTGDLRELLEPGFAPAFFPEYLNNAKFPGNWREQTSHCKNGCTECGYCEAVYAAVSERYPVRTKQIMRMETGSSRKRKFTQSGEVRR